MNFFKPDSLLVANIIQAICRTLLHSLWQGVLLAIFISIILLTTKKSLPALRYNLFAVSLLSFVAAGVFTFCIELDQESNRKFSGDSFSFYAENVSLGLKEWNVVYESGFKEKLLMSTDSFLRENAGILVGIWLLVFSLKSLKAMAGLLYINRLKHSATKPGALFWTAELARLARNLGVRKNVLLLESDIVTVPMVIGVLKPIILTPLGFFAMLPASQIEAILLHELAHIKRSDYAVNLVQNFCDNVFFFNPAVLWVSALIREEREHCCDELAMSVIENRTSLVQALVSFQEYKVTGISQAMAFPGRRNVLLDRIKRIIYKHNKPLNAMEKLFVTASLITATLLTAAFSPVVKKDLESLKPKVEKAFLEVKVQPVKSMVTMADTVIRRRRSVHVDSGTSNIETTKNGKRYALESVDGKLTSLKIDGQLIAPDKIGAYQKEVDEIMQEVKEARDKAEIARQDADKARAKADVLRQKAESDRNEAEKLRASADKMREEANQARIVADEGRKNAEEGRKLAELGRLEASKLRLEAEKLRLLAEENRKSAEVLRKEADVARQQADKERVKFEKMQEEIIGDLTNAGVLKDKQNFSYKLNNTELIVNGVKQPAALHEKMRAKYVKSDGWEIVYHMDGRTGVSITK